MVEYGLILGLISILILTMFILFNNLVGAGGMIGEAVNAEALGGHQASLSAQVY